MHCQVTLVLAILVVPLACPSAKGADSASPPATLLTQRGKLLVSEDFAKPVQISTAASLSKLTSGWRLRPGKWEFVEGAMRGTQLEKDHHSAVAAYAVAFKNAVIQYDVQLNGCRQAILRVNDPHEHICRVIVKPDSFAAQKDDHDHDGSDEAVSFGTVAMSIRPVRWTTVLVEILGDEMVATIDGHSIAGSHPLISTEKANIGFVVTGIGGAFRNLRIWDATPNPSWAETESKLPSTQPPAKD
ncbi:MAG TPA: hypothetical protein VHV77_04835 [Pirellulales bacterium]|nr:hypothetical protein [Pirellulales bacterium]